MGNKFRESRVELFNEELCDYNPLFVGQGDAPTHDMAFGLRYISPAQALDIDVGCLTGLDLGRVVSDFLRGTTKVNPDDYDPKLSPLTPVAKPLIAKVHKEVPVATAAYQKSILSAYRDIKTNKLDAAKVLESLSKKGVSATIAVETFKMIERGVPVQHVKNEVIDLVNKAGQKKPASVSRKPVTVRDIVKIDTTPEVPMKAGGSPSVTKDELSKTTTLIYSDPVIQGHVKSTGKSTSQAATEVAVNQVDHVLATLASKGIIEGQRQPTDSEVAKAVEAQPVSPQPIVTPSTSSKLPWVLGGMALIAVAIGLSK